MKTKTKQQRLKYTCHFCDKKSSSYKNELIVQSFTGRRFCSMACWTAHNESKGF